MASVTNIRCRLNGVRPIMFDRYAGDNATQLPTADRMYLDSNQGLVLPSLNLFSLLCAKNTDSVCRQFFGKQGKKIGLGIGGYVTIDPFDIPIIDASDGDKQIVFTGFGDKVTEHVSVARLKGGIPNPKTRPVIKTPWSMLFTIRYAENNYCTLENLRQALSMGGSLGLGTFRPFFGLYMVAEWKEIAE